MRAAHLVCVVIWAACVPLGAAADRSSAAAHPRAEAGASRLVAALRRDAGPEGDVVRSRIVAGRTRQWLAVAISARTQRVEIFRWSHGAWRKDATVATGYFDISFVEAVRLSGSGDPDFALEGCGAGDNNCLNVLSHVGGRWHLVPFEYGYGRSLEVNGTPYRNGVSTEVDACGCAGGPSTWTFERFSHGVFRPAWPRWRQDTCSAERLQTIAYTWEIQVLRFDHLACADGWALATGTGTGFTGRVVGLFVSGPKGWELLTLDNGNALPAAPAVYDLPLSLLERLGAPLRSVLPAELAAARLVGRLHRQQGVEWPLQEGIVRVNRSAWLVALVPSGKIGKADVQPVGAAIYRWRRGAWVIDGRISRVSSDLDLSYYGGWFVPVETARGGVTFAVAGERHGPVLTNSGGTWRMDRR